MNKILGGVMAAAVIALGVFAGLKAYDKWGNSLPTGPANG